MTPLQGRLRDALAAAPAEASRAALASGRSLELAPSPGEWSSREVLLHLAAVDEEVWRARLDALQAEAFPHWPWVEPGLWAGPGDASFEGALAAFAARRAAIVGHLDVLDDAGWARTGRHATFGVLDVARLMKIALDHDAEHIAQIRNG